MAIYIDDKELVAAHQAGDTEAFEELVREYRPALFTHGRRKLYCDATAEDAVQETLVRAYRALPKFNGEYQLGPWLHRIMANVCIDEVNRRRRDGERVEKIASQPSSEFGVPGVEEELGLDLDYSDLKRALGEMPDSYSEALKLRFVEGLEYDQLAQIAGVSEQNARARVSRARGVMKAALKGVAALPLILLGLLRRGEKAAAAATSTATASSVGATTTGAVSQIAPSAMPALSEAAVSIGQAAPAVVPAIAKAAMAVGITAAVLTPTGDSAVHQAVNDAISAPIPAETIVLNVDEGDASGVLDRAEAAVSAAQFTESGDGISISRTDRVANDGDEGTSIGNVVSSSTATGLTKDNSSLGTLTAAALVLKTEGAGRFGLEGQATLELAGQLVTTQMDSNSWLRMEQSSDVDGAQRIDGLLLLATSNDLTYELRLAGFATLKDSAYQIDGLFRLAGSDEILRRGRMLGKFQLLPGNENATMEIALRP